MHNAFMHAFVCIFVRLYIYALIYGFMCMHIAYFYACIYHLATSRFYF